MSVSLDFGEAAGSSLPLKSQFLKELLLPFAVSQGLLPLTPPTPRLSAPDTAQLPVPNHRY